MLAASTALAASFFISSIFIASAFIASAGADDATLIADEGTVLDMRPTAQARGDLWLNNKPHAQPLIGGFERRWAAAAHNMPVVPLGLG